MRLGFYMAQAGGWPDKYDRLYLDISTDNGVTWQETSVSPRAHNPDVSGREWFSFELDLSPYAGVETFRFSFRSYADQGNDLFVDDVTVDPIGAFFPCPCTLKLIERDSGCPGQTSDHSIAVTCVKVGEINYSSAGGSWDSAPSVATSNFDHPHTEVVQLNVEVSSIAPLMESQSHELRLVPRVLPSSYQNIPVDTFYNGAMGQWENKAPLPEARFAVAHVSTDTHVFVIGGASDKLGEIPTNTNYRYNILGDRWETMAPLPSLTMAAAAGEINGKIYLPGLVNDILDPNTYVYDINSDSWSVIPPNNGFTGMSFYGVAVDPNAGKLYRIGGSNDVGGDNTLVSKSEVWVLDVITKRWSRLPDLEYARVNPNVGYIQGKLYVAGGATYPDYDPVIQTEVFNGTSWSLAAPIPEIGLMDRWTYAGYAAVRGQLYVFNGRRGLEWFPINSTGMYMPSRDGWYETPLLPPTWGGSVYLGGSGNSDSLWASGGRSIWRDAIYDQHQTLKLCVPQGDLFLPLIFP